MKIRSHKRLFALLLVLTLVVGMIPSALADNEPDISAAESTKESLVESQTEAEPVISPPIQSILESDEAVEDSEVETEDEAPTSMDGETLTRTDNGGIMLLDGGGTMGKSTCVTFSAYQTSRWKCHRYEVDGSHSYGHYFYTSEIAYHTIDGVDAYCVEPNTSSLGGQYYTSYTADEASSSSYWKLELDDLQRSHIQKILAFGYPQVDYGYSRQVQYRTYKNAEGERICDTVPVKLYGKQVELFQRFAYPGSRIAILGDFEPSPFENSSPAHSFLIKARYLEFLSYKKQGETPEDEVLPDEVPLQEGA